MIGTLTIPLGGAPLNLTPVISTGKVNSRCQKSCNALLNVTDVDPPVDSTSRGRRCCSFYEVLRVKRNATPTEIRTAYRNLAKVYHPDALDLEEHDDRTFIEIHNAYATLHDPAERAMYDRNMGTGLGRRIGTYTAGGMRRGFYVSRRWETDQCW